MQRQILQAQTRRLDANSNNHISWKQREHLHFANQNSNKWLLMPTWTSHPKHINNTHTSKFQTNFRKQEDIRGGGGNYNLEVVNLAMNSFSTMRFLPQTLTFYAIPSSNILLILNYYSKKKVMQNEKLIIEHVNDKLQMYG